jgi:hypothetical protein
MEKLTQAAQELVASQAAASRTDRSAVAQQQACTGLQGELDSVKAELARVQRELQEGNAARAREYFESEHTFSERVKALHLREDALKKELSQAQLDSLSASHNAETWKLRAQASQEERDVTAEAIKRAERQRDLAHAAAAESAPTAIQLGLGSAPTADSVANGSRAGDSSPARTASTAGDDPFGVFTPADGGAAAPRHAARPGAPLAPGPPSEAHLAELEHGRHRLESATAQRDSLASQLEDVEEASTNLQPQP